MAIDQSAADAKPWVEEAKAEHPSLVDAEHIVPELYGMINVPTVVWIDEEGSIARPPAAEFGTDLFLELHGRESAPHLEALRNWVRNGSLPTEGVEKGPDHHRLATTTEQQARTEYALAWHLHKSGDHDAAERHFKLASELSPFDWTVRRASLPIRGIDSMSSPEFLEMFQEWNDAGQPSYE